MLTRLIYFSENQVLPGKVSMVETLSDILRASNRNNRPLGLTGALVFDDQWFLQVLEGDHGDVWRTYERLLDDERHSGVVIRELVDVDQRVFANWWMGLATRNAKTEATFRPYLYAGRLDPRQMSAKQMLGLMIEVSRLGLSRELAVAA